MSEFVHCLDLCKLFYEEIEPLDWLTFPQHRLLDIVSGEVYHDDTGLQAFRDQFAYYPKDVWLYLLLATWGRIGQEEHLMGRAGSSGDEIGAALTNYVGTLSPEKLRILNTALRNALAIDEE